MPAERVVVVAFSPVARILGKCSTINFPPALFLSFFCVCVCVCVVVVDISWRTLIPLFRPGSVHSGSPS